MYPSITPFLWFEKDMSGITALYKNTFGDAFVIKSIQSMGDTPSGTVEIADITLHNLSMTFMTAGPQFVKNPSISISLSFDSKEELTRVWEALSKNGKVLMPLQEWPFAPLYGWVDDAYGVSWQLIYLPEANFPKCYPSLMFTQGVAGKASEAIDFYTSLFPASKVHNKIPYGENAGDIPTYLSHAEFELSNTFMIGMDSSAPHQFTFNEAVSLVVSCKGQDEVDRYWEALTKDGGQESMCGWCKDKYGVSWQIVPQELHEALGSSDRTVADYATKHMLSMKKIVIKDLYHH